MRFPNTPDPIFLLETLTQFMPHMAGRTGKKVSADAATEAGIQAVFHDELMGQLDISPFEAVDAMDVSSVPETFDLSDVFSPTMRADLSHLIKKGVLVATQGAQPLTPQEQDVLAVLQRLDSFVTKVGLQRTDWRDMKRPAREAIAP